MSSSIIEVAPFVFIFVLRVAEMSEWLVKQATL